ncbi:cell wall-active antibiotics response protein LiaF [Saccharibacillus sp. JS10]|uniref:cell wall-active antibiotics response protein LiaF n=1 Tax=Saccharibacillus sp. JS10 TaxID=2950552 RepID=UPI00210E6D00|nr:cell wall-active antibiotics response protein LiaF [Saccharibacillus sp. JS10]MCQ4086884.1 cell wall-active antibiotics response protein LiaF [Saccharibacillus sp. JS10]
MKRSGALWLIVMGVGFMAYQAGFITYGIGDLIRTFWPMILIMVGLSQLLSTKKHSSSVIGHVILIAIGGYFQVRNLGLTDMGTGEFFKFMIPAGLIAIGVYTLFKPKSTPDYPLPRPEESHHIPPYNGNHQHFPPTPPTPPSPIEPLESPLDRMFVNLDKKEFDPNHQENHREKYQEQEHPKSEKNSEFQKIGDMAREIGKQTADQVRKIDFSRIAEEVKHEVDSAMKDFKKSSTHDSHHHTPGKVSLDKEPFAQNVSDDPRFYGYDSEEMKKTRQQADKEKKDKTVNESNFIGDYYIGRDYFKLKPLNISHFVGDTVIDLTKAQIPYGTTKINVSSFIGDVVIYMPNDPEVGVKVNSSSFLGNHNVLGKRRTGMVSGVDETQNYDECSKRLKIHVSSFISDVNVNIVG